MRRKGGERKRRSKERGCTGGWINEGYGSLPVTFLYPLLERCTMQIEQKIGILVTWFIFAALERKAGKEEGDRWGWGWVTAVVWFVSYDGLLKVSDKLWGGFQDVCKARSHSCNTFRFSFICTFILGTITVTTELKMSLLKQVYHDLYLSTKVAGLSSLCFHERFLTCTCYSYLYTPVHTNMYIRKHIEDTL